MKFLLFLFLFLQFGCATKYIVPGNRFMTPESQGGVFRTSAELQFSTANQLTADTDNGTVDEGVFTETVKRSGFALSSSLLEQLDLIWTHTGGGNSLFGGKFQFLGAPKTANGVGHKMAISASIGGNEHETDTKTKVEFELTGKEYQLLYGYRFSEMILLYSNLAYSKFNFSGTLHSSNPSLNGLKPAFETTVTSLYAGMELDLGSFFTKAELGRQELKTTDSNQVSHFVFGYALGYTF